MRLAQCGGRTVLRISAVLMPSTLIFIDRHRIEPDAPNLKLVAAPDGPGVGRGSLYSEKSLLTATFILNGFSAACLSHPITCARSRTVSPCLSQRTSKSG